MLPRTAPREAMAPGGPMVALVALVSSTQAHKDSMERSTPALEASSVACRHVAERESTDIPSAHRDRSSTHQLGRAVGLEDTMNRTAPES